MVRKSINGPESEKEVFIFYFHPLERDRRQCSKRAFSMNEKATIENFCTERTIKQTIVRLIVVCVFFALIFL